MEIQWFFCYLNFTWNHFWSYWLLKSLKKCHIDNLGPLNFWKFFTFANIKFSKNQNLKLPKLFKWQFLNFWNQPKLISRKIKSWRKIAKFLHWKNEIFTLIWKMFRVNSCQRNLGLDVLISRKAKIDFQNYLTAMIMYSYINELFH